MVIQSIDAVCLIANLFISNLIMVKGAKELLIVEQIAKDLCIRLIIKKKKNE